MSCLKIINTHSDLYLLRPTVERITRAVGSSEQVNIKNITLIVSDDATLAELKKEYFHENAFTDTISFNFNQPGEPIEGEIYLSIDRIRENAKEYGTPFDRELIAVYIHSLLHLMGYRDDSAQSRKKMFALQNFYVQQQDLTRLYRRHHNH